MHIKKNLFKIISIFLFIIFFSICCFITYLIINKEHNPNYKLDSYISHLNNIYKILDDDLYSKENISKSLENIYILQESKKNINTSLKVHETKTFNHLINSSELYIKQISNLQSDSENINENIVALKNHFDQIILNLKSLPANSNILTETINTISNVQDAYENNFYSEKINSISTLSLNKFISEVNSIMYEFLPLIENIDEKLKKARDNKYDYQLILNTLEKNLNVLKNLKSKLSKLPIPQEGLSIYHEIEEILDLYYEYNTKLKYSIKNEHLSEANELTDENLQKMYEQTEFVYSKILNKYNTLKHKIDSKVSISNSLYN